MINWKYCEYYLVTLYRAMSFSEVLQKGFPLTWGVT